MREQHPRRRSRRRWRPSTAQAALPRSRRGDPRRLPDPGARVRAASRSSTSTTPRPRRSRESVIEAIDSYYRHSNANVHRSMHELAAEASELYEGGRAKVAGSSARARARSCSCATRPRRSTSCATPGRASTSAPGDVVLITEMEHHSNVVPWQLLCQEQGARLEYLRVDGEGRLDLDGARRALAGRRREAGRGRPTSRTCSARSTRSPRSRERAHAAGAKVLVDGAQAVPQLPVDVQATGADFYAFTGHKMLGPDRHRRAVGRAASCSRRCRRSWAAAR